MAIYTSTKTPESAPIGSGSAISPTLDVKTSEVNTTSILEWSVFSLGSIATVMGLARSNNVPVQLFSQSFVPDDPNSNESYTKMAAAWSTPPTTAGIYLRRTIPAAVTGSGVIWTFPRGLHVNVNSSLSLWNLTSVSPTSPITVSVMVDE